MRKIVVFLMMLLVAGCTMFEAGKVSDERKELYNRNNDREFCERNPDKCINGVPWM